ncbi:MAG: hypothetical protein HY706_08160 [Candidatus Hydrogenedentes bacterium]|nr:hypothetical protein [Candidatus Hydrogenedentota bacterium]
MNEFTESWRNLSPEARFVLQDGGLLLAGLLVGWLLGSLVKRFLVTKGVDAYFRFPWHPPSIVSASTGQVGPRKVEPSLLTKGVGWLVTGTVWAGAIMGIARLHGGDATVQFIELVLARGWQVGVFVVVAALVSGYLARATYDFLQTPWLKHELDVLFGQASGTEASFSETVARGICVLIYAVFVLVAFIVMVGVFNGASMSGLIGPAWEICGRLFTGLAAFAIGYFGLIWVQSLSRSKGKEGADHSELEYFVGLGITIVTTLLALGVVTGVSSTAGVLVILALLALFAYLLWPMRAQLHDLWSGLVLRLQNAQTGELDGVSFEVKAVGPLTTRIEAEGQESNRRNSEILAATLRSAEEKT